MAEGRDWTRSQFERCPDCGTNASLTADEELGNEILRAVATWGRLLAPAETARTRQRPEPTVWSALEYACHVRDLLPVMTGRVAEMIEHDNPSLDWWDHEAAAVEDAYNAQVPVLVIEGMTANARAFADRLSGLTSESWGRTAERRPGETFTVRGIARFVLHEVIHHREDASRSLKGATS